MVSYFPCWSVLVIEDEVCITWASFSFIPNVPRDGAKKGPVDASKASFVGKVLNILCKASKPEVLTPQYNVVVVGLVAMVLTFLIFTSKWQSSLFLWMWPATSLWIHSWDRNGIYFLPSFHIKGIWCLWVWVSMPQSFNFSKLSWIPIFHRKTENSVGILDQMPSANVSLWLFAHKVCVKDMMFLEVTL